MGYRREGFSDAAQAALAASARAASARGIHCLLSNSPAAAPHYAGLPLETFRPPHAMARGQVAGGENEMLVWT